MHRSIDHIRKPFLHFLIFNNFFPFLFVEPFFGIDHRKMSPNKYTQKATLGERGRQWVIVEYEHWALNNHSVCTLNIHSTVAAYGVKHLMLRRATVTQITNKYYKTVLFFTAHYFIFFSPEDMKHLILWAAFIYFSDALTNRLKNKIQQNLYRFPFTFRFLFQSIYIVFCSQEKWYLCE